jgi:hypothetical protein
MRVTPHMICVDEAVMVEAVSASETSINFYETTRHTIPEDCRLSSLDRAWAVLKPRFVVYNLSICNSFVKT